MNFNEIAYVNRLVKAEETIAGLISGQEQLLKKITAVEYGKKCQHSPTVSKEATVSREETFKQKYFLCKRILFDIELLKLEFEKELLYCDPMGDEEYYSYSEMCGAEDSLQELRAKINAFYDED